MRQLGIIDCSSALVIGMYFPSISFSNRSDVFAFKYRSLNSVNDAKVDREGNGPNRLLYKSKYCNRFKQPNDSGRRPAKNKSKT